MTLEQQVVSLELAKKMKELGFKQESLFYWRSDNGGKYRLVDKSHSRIMPSGMNWKIDLISAYTVAELGEMLPERFVSKRNSDNEWLIFDIDKVRKFQEYIVLAYENTEADARAKMLIYLKENNLL